MAPFQEIDNSHCRHHDRVGTGNNFCFKGEINTLAPARRIRRYHRISKIDDERNSGDPFGQETQQKVYAGFVRGHYRAVPGCSKQLNQPQGRAGYPFGT
ncbi:MAG: hypothetical protein A2Z90_20025 [Burkholderiales bacterium GWA2_64_37]|nr:hypothetical protein AE621_13120 [Acidovorax sp. SD340]OGA82067.1 MAG: hypothetical protein A2Z90_20025 [Burkholderiales bacterium GWA2_64_37]